MLWPISIPLNVTGWIQEEELTRKELKKKHPIWKALEFAALNIMFKMYNITAICISKNHLQRTHVHFLFQSQASEF